MSIYQLIDFLNDELRAATDEPRYRKLDEAIDCLVRVKEENESLREALEEIGGLSSAYSDMNQPEKALREALQDISELTDVYADMSAA